MDVVIWSDKCLVCKYVLISMEDQKLHSGTGFFISSLHVSRRYFVGVQARRSDLLKSRAIFEYFRK